MPMCKKTLAAAAMALVSGAALAQTPAPQQPQAPMQQQTPATPPATPGAGVGANPSVTMERVVIGGRRASQVIGARVRNSQNENVGSVEDLLIGPDGRITQVVLSVGGFLGIGERLVAVPLSELRTGSEDRIYLMNVSKEELGRRPEYRS